MHRNLASPALADRPSLFSTISSQLIALLQRTYSLCSGRTCEQIHLVTVLRRGDVTSCGFGGRRPRLSRDGECRAYVDVSRCAICKAGEAPPRSRPAAPRPSPLAPRRDSRLKHVKTRARSPLHPSRIVSQSARLARNPSRTRAHAHTHSHVATHAHSHTRRFLNMTQKIALFSFTTDTLTRRMYRVSL